MNFSILNKTSGIDMQSNAGESHSDANLIPQNHFLAGFPLPLSLGETMSNFSNGQMVNRNILPESNEIWNVPMGRDTTRDFTINNSYSQISHIQEQGQFSEAIHFTNTSLTHLSSNGPTENQEKLTTLNPFAYPFENILNSGFENLPFDFNNKFVVPENSASSQFSNELSLSLGNSILEKNSEIGSSGVTSFNSHEPIPFNPGSRFFRAMQEILAEIACYSLLNYDSTSLPEIKGPDFSINEDRRFQRREEVEVNKKNLLALLQVVDDQYTRCLDEVHTVISAFHAVTELDPNLHARFALPKISSMYKNIRGRISSHILSMGSANINSDGEEEKSFETSFIEKQWALQQLRKRDPQLWKPQRGLPERSVSVLRAWMFQNFLHPYPKDAEKHLLALKSGLTRCQVSNWFINARVRLWKPLIEEMYAEMNRRKARHEETEGTIRNRMRFENRSFAMD